MKQMRARPRTSLCKRLFLKRRRTVKIGPSLLGGVERFSMTRSTCELGQAGSIELEACHGKEDHSQGY